MKVANYVLKKKRTKNHDTFNEKGRKTKYLISGNDYCLPEEVLLSQRFQFLKGTINARIGFSKITTEMVL